MKKRHVSVDPSSVKTAAIRWVNDKPVDCDFAPYQELIDDGWFLKGNGKLVIEAIGFKAPRERQGGMLKCADAAARIREAAARAGMDIIEVPPKIWKHVVFGLRGDQKPSKAIVARLLKSIGCNDDIIKKCIRNEHKRDATGIGLWWLAMERQKAAIERKRK